MPHASAGRRRIPADAADAGPQRPRATLLRHLKALADHDLILHARRDDYATPHASTHALILSEPDAYHRSLLLYDDVLPLRGAPPHAFACLPVRHAIDFEIPLAVPVIPPEPDLAKRLRGMPYRDALRHAVSSTHISLMTRRFPSDAANDPTAIERAFPVLDAATALALFAATADPRLTRACRDAAATLGTDADTVIRKARSFHPDEPPLSVLRPNTVIYPGWLQPLVRSAQRVHARRHVRGADA